MKFIEVLQRRTIQELKKWRIRAKVYYNHRTRTLTVVALEYFRTLRYSLGKDVLDLEEDLEHTVGLENINFRIFETLKPWECIFKRIQFFIEDDEGIPRRSKVSDKRSTKQNKKNKKDSNNKNSNYSNKKDDEIHQKLTKPIINIKRNDGY